MTAADYEEELTLFADERPAYHVRSMEERKLIPRNGLVAASTFSGCGGSSLGLKTAGFTIPYAAEFTPQGAATYRANAPETFVDQRDIREIMPDEILERLGMQVGELDLFEGSPPCSSFSGAGVARSGRLEDTRGKVKAYSEGIKQSTDDLFDEWCRLVEGIRPKAILAENVPDLAKAGAPAQYLFGIQKRLNQAGYQVHVGIYSSLWAGAATFRKRLIIMGVREDIGPPPRPKLRGSGHTLREGLAALPVPNPADELMESWQDGTGRDSQTGEPLPVYKVAHHWANCLGPDHGRPQFHSRDVCLGPKDENGKYPSLLSLGRASWDTPLATVTATGRGKGAACIMHPDECRRFTPTEVKWLSGFPADFILTGLPTNRYERIGRAVTPPLYEALGPYLERAIKGETS